MTSTSSSGKSGQFDVFLSFRGADTRNSFTSHLYNALCRERINAFMDKKLARGDEISSTLFQVIESSQISIVIFSKNYASSSYCMEELEKILECKASRGQVVLPLFYKVDPLEVEKQMGSYAKAFSGHEAEFRGFRRFIHRKNIRKEKMEKVRRWKLALASAADLSGWDLRNRDEAEVIQEVVLDVLEKLNQPESGFILNVPETGGEVIPARNLVGKDFRRSTEMIWEWLTLDNISSIGIHGMGGVGKTTLVIHIHNKLLDQSNLFGQVYWITVSQDFSVYKLQNLIAEVIGVDFDTEEDVMKRSARLSKILSGRECILILDDLWKHFDMKKVGIPTENRCCKVIVTTRSLDVCMRMGMEKIKKVEPLSKEEAWYLFAETLGHDLATDVEVAAKSVARECAGLPLGIVTIAGSMRGVEDIHEWNNALTELQRSEVSSENMEDEVFQILRFSYTRLSDWKLQQCFLYLALFPEDYQISREVVIQFLISEGIIEQQMSRQSDFDKGHAILNKLEKVSLLEGFTAKTGTRYLKMHDLIRDMAIQIMKESSPSMTEARKQLKVVPEEKFWTENIVRVSLMSNDICEIASDFSPACPNLSTLFLSRNAKLKSVPDSFFDQLQGLKVLDLCRTAIEKLPESVVCLGNLRALFLRRCENLNHVPSLMKLVSLEMLDLSFCKALEQVPDGLESLSRLKFLNFLGTGLKKLRPGMLTRLSCLQFLAFNGRFRTSADVTAEDLAALQKLESLHWCFSDFEGFKKYVQLTSGAQTGRQRMNYFLSVGTYHQRTIRAHGRMDRRVILQGCTITGDLLIQKDLETLKVARVTICGRNGLRMKTSPGTDCFETKLKSLSIRYGKNISYLFHSSTSPSILQNLEGLKILSLPKLCSLFGSEGVGATEMPYAAMFSCLKKFKIWNCKTMKLLFPPGLLLNFRNLEVLYVRECSEMEEIVAAKEDEAARFFNRSGEFNLPKLKILKLVQLPKLKSICRAQIVCDSLQQIDIEGCYMLKKLPVSRPSSSLLPRIVLGGSVQWQWQGGDCQI